MGTSELIRPNRLSPGDKIGIIAPSSAVRDDRLTLGIASIENRGYKVELGKHLFDQHGFVAGSNKSRASDFTEMFERSDIHAVFCVRGGYGAMRMVDLVDWDIIRANPKIFVGFSDITTLHLRILHEVNMVSIHGPVVTTLGGGLSEIANNCFWHTLENAIPFGMLQTNDTSISTLVPGKAVGKLAGGCIELIADAIGTPEHPNFDGCIVALEDVGERAYQIDRQLMQLKRAGLFDNVVGFVLGTVTDWDKDETGPIHISLQDIWREHIIPFGKPTIAGFPFGHIDNPLTLPLGCRAELDAETKSLTILESAVN